MTVVFSRLWSNATNWVSALLLGSLTALAQSPVQSPEAQAFVKKAQEMEHAAEAARDQALAAKWPAGKTDREIDNWLRDISPYYKYMSDQIGTSGGYQFRAGKGSGAESVVEDLIRYIELPETLRGPERGTFLIFEVGNLLQEAKHTQINRDVEAGRITSPAEFAIFHLIVEFDGLKLHRQVLEEVGKSLGGIPKEMYRWIGAPAAGRQIYEMPMLYDFIKTCEANGRFQRYVALFTKLKKPEVTAPAGVDQPAQAERK